MSNIQQVPEGKDPELWEIAQKRAGFKSHALTYVIINGFLWAVWYFTSHPKTFDFENNTPWPIWSTIGWGIGLAFHYARAYVFPRSNATEREYEKLKKQQ